MKAQGILGGHAVTGDYPELGNAVLVCTTETKRDDDLARYADKHATPTEPLWRRLCARLPSIY